MSATEQTALPWTRRLLMAIAVPLIYMAARLLQASCRIQPVAGERHLDTLLAEGKALIPCCWHQRLFFCVAYLLDRRSPDFEPGFLVSPSRDGELISRIVQRFGATIVRGSATRTGAKALRELFRVVRTGISPISHPDGPSGPPYQCKPGSLLLSQITGAPLLPLAYSADRYWQLGSWDRLIIPKPFARITLAIGEPVRVQKKEDLEEAGNRLQAAINAATLAADEAAGSAPEPRPPAVREA